MARKRSLVAILAGLVLLTVSSASILACTVIGVTPGASATASSSGTQTNDGGASHWAMEMIPAKDYPAGAMYEVVQLQQGSGGYTKKQAMLTPLGKFIPQVSHTFAYIEGHMGYLNEHQVGMNESTISAKRGIQNAAGWFEITQLSYLAAQRAKTAREAIKIMGDLATTYGFHDDGEMLIVTDPNEVWVFEIVGPGQLWEPGDSEPGAYWVAKRVPDGEITSAANNSMIKNLIYNDPDKMMMTPGIEEWAIKMGLYNPASGVPFNWRDDVCAANTRATNCGRRVWSVYNMVSPGQAKSLNEADLPFSIKPDNKLTMTDIFNLNRDHYEGTAYDDTHSILSGGFSNPRRYGTIRSSSGTSYSVQRLVSVLNSEHTTVTQSRNYLPNEIGGVLWYGANIADTSCFVPLYIGMSTITPSLNTKTGSHWDFTRESLWWAFSAVNTIVEAKWSYMIKDVQKYQAKYETTMVENQFALDQAAMALYKTDKKLAVEFLTNYCNNYAETVRDAWWQLADNLLWKYHSGAIYDFENGNRRSSYVWDPIFVTNVFMGIDPLTVQDIRRPQVLQ